MDVSKITKKHMKLLSIAFTLVVCFAGIGTVVYADEMEARYDYQTNEQSIGGMIIGALVGVVIAVNVIPIIANQTKSLESNADLDTNEQGLVGIWPLLVIIGVMVAIVGLAI